jgi:pilus assembly protein CpaC
MSLVPAAALALFAQTAGVGTASAQGTAREEITLAVGEQTSLSADNVKAYSEGVPGVIDVRLPKDKSEFVVVALKPGTTSLLLIYEDGSKRQYRFQVVGRTTEGKVSKRENIRLDFYFVELSETYSHQIGVGWPADIGGGGVFRASAVYDLVNRNLISGTAVVANQPLPRLDLLQATGWARLSRQAVLVTANGNHARFSSGGEVNLAIQGALTAEIRQIEFGSIIQVLPLYDPETGRIELSISADVSDLTDERGSGVPGRTVSRLETQVNLELGQGVMLAGLTAHSESKTDAGLPLLSQIPVLGYLFGTHNNREEQVKNVLFIVPTVVDMVQANARGRITEALRVYERYGGGIDEVDFLKADEPNRRRKPSSKREKK